MNGFFEVIPLSRCEFKVVCADCPLSSLVLFVIWRIRFLASSLRPPVRPRRRHQRPSSRHRGGTFLFLQIRRHHWSPSRQQRRRPQRRRIHLYLLRRPRRSNTRRTRHRHCRPCRHIIIPRIQHILRRRRTRPTTRRTQTARRHRTLRTRPRRRPTSQRFVPLQPLTRPRFQHAPWAAIREPPRLARTRRRFAPPQVCTARSDGRSHPWHHPPAPLSLTPPEAYLRHVGGRREDPRAPRHRQTLSSPSTPIQASTAFTRLARRHFPSEAQLPLLLLAASTVREFGSLH